MDAKCLAIVSGGISHVVEVSRGTQQLHYTEQNQNTIGESDTKVEIEYCNYK